MNRCHVFQHPRWPLDKMIRNLWSEAPAVNLGEDNEGGGPLFVEGVGWGGMA